MANEGGKTGERRRRRRWRRRSFLGKSRAPLKILEKSGSMKYGNIPSPGTSRSLSGKVGTGGGGTGGGRRSGGGKEKEMEMEMEMENGVQ